MTSKKLFKDRKGNIVIAQSPNVLIIAWVVLSLTNLFVFHMHQRGLSLLGTATLFAWSYNELTRGVNRFRQTLGGVILLLIIVTAFV